MIAEDDSSSDQPNSIEMEFDLKHPPAKVWRALSEPELLHEWLLPVINFKLESGTPFTFTAPPQPGWDGLVHCKILDFETERKLTYSWTVGELNTVVTFTLIPTERGTRLLLVHSGFQPDQKKNLGGARYGWNMMSQKLIELLDTIPDTQP